MNDTERLNYLQSLEEGYGAGWILRSSEIGRGMRLHETSAPGASPTVREAIDAHQAAYEDMLIEREEEK